MSRPPLAYPELHSRVRKGDVAELAFMTRAMRFGFNVSKPLNRDCPYDVVVEAEGRFSRVQVKSAWTGRVGTGKEYIVRVCRRPSRRFYSSNEVDYFAAYVAQEDAWYIIPHFAIREQSVIGVFPHDPQSRGRLEKFRDAWDLFLPRGVLIGDLKAMADPEFATEPSPEGAK